MKFEPTTGGGEEEISLALHKTSPLILQVPEGGFSVDNPA
jgi:hypothetical protein